MTIKLLGVEVDEKLLSKLIQSNERENVNFDNKFFSRQLDELEVSVEKLAKAGKDFKDDYIQLKRLYDSLAKVNEWFIAYNYTEKYPEDVVTKATKLVQVKTSIPNFKSIDKNMYLKMDGTGIFAPIELYIIPFKLVDTDFEKPIEVFRNVSLKTSHNPSQDRNEYNLPSDGLYGSCRAISKTHFAVIVGDQNNPIGTYLKRNLDWRYVASDGFAM